MSWFFFQNDAFLKPYDVNELLNKSRLDLTSSGGNSPSASYSQIEDEKKQNGAEKTILAESCAADTADK